VAFDPNRLPSELLELGVVENKSPAVLGRHGHGLDAGPRVGVRHLRGLPAQGSRKHGGTAGPEVPLIKVELVGIHRALHDRLPEPVASGDEHHVAEARLRIEGEGDAARREVAPDHELHSGGNAHVLVAEALVDPIGDRAVVEKRSEHALHRPEHFLFPVHVQKRLLLAGEGGVGHIFGRRRGTHGERPVAISIGAFR
jgi:hypothetical protein